MEPCICDRLFSILKQRLLRSSQLRQIAARVRGSDSSPAFSVYLLPTEAVSPAASEDTGLAVATIEGESSNSQRQASHVTLAAG